MNESGLRVWGEGDDKRDMNRLFGRSFSRPGRVEHSVPSTQYATKNLAGLAPIRT